MIVELRMNIVQGLGDSRPQEGGIWFEIEVKLGWADFRTQPQVGIR